jgi:hypothetical protein
MMGFGLNSFSSFRRVYSLSMMRSALQNHTTADFLIGFCGDEKHADNSRPPVAVPFSFRQIRSPFIFQHMSAAGPACGLGG